MCFRIYFKINHILITRGTLLFSICSIITAPTMTLNYLHSAGLENSSGLESLDCVLFTLSWQLSPACSVILAAGLSSSTIITSGPSLERFNWTFCLLGLAVPRVLLLVSGKGRHVRALRVYTNYYVRHNMHLISLARTILINASRSSCLFAR